MRMEQKAKQMIWLHSPDWAWTCNGDFHQIWPAVQFTIVGANLEFVRLQLLTSFIFMPNTLYCVLNVISPLLRNVSAISSHIIKRCIRTPNYQTFVRSQKLKPMRYTILIQEFWMRQTPVFLNCFECLFQSDDEVDDTITLRGCGQITQWHFPKKIKCCPVKKCFVQFEHRSKAISHYKRHHAKNYMFCSICEKPISTSYPQDFVRHYDQKHPGIEVPFNVSNSELFFSRLVLFR